MIKKIIYLMFIVFGLFGIVLGGDLVLKQDYQGIIDDYTQFESDGNYIYYLKNQNIYKKSISDLDKNSEGIILLNNLMFNDIKGYNIKYYNGKLYYRNMGHLQSINVSNNQVETIIDRNTIGGGGIGKFIIKDNVVLYSNFSITTNWEGKQIFNYNLFYKKNLNDNNGGQVITGYQNGENVENWDWNGNYMIFYKNPNWFLYKNGNYNNIGNFQNYQFNQDNKSLLYITNNGENYILTKVEFENLTINNIKTINLPIYLLYYSYKYILYKNELGGGIILSNLEKVGYGTGIDGGMTSQIKVVNNDSFYYFDEKFPTWGVYKGVFDFNSLIEKIVNISCEIPKTTTLDEKRYYYFINIYKNLLTNIVRSKDKSRCNELYLKMCDKKQGLSSKIICEQIIGS